MMTYASTDVTYCTNEDCPKKCWRHVSKHRFNKDDFYWYMSICPKEKERQDCFERSKR